MRTLPRVRASFLAVSFLLLLLVVHAQGQTSVSPPSHTQTQPQVLNGAKPTVDQALSAGLWRVDRSFQSSIQINNRHILQHRTVIPVLYMADGTEYDLPSVDVSPNSLATISINNAIESAPPQVSSHLSLYGSASIHFLAPTSGSISAAMQIIDVANSLNFVYPFHPPDRMDAAQHTFDGLWWRRDAGVTGFLGLANRTSAAIQVSLQAIGAAGTATATETVVLGDHATQLLSLDEIAATLPRNQNLMGGLHLVFTGKSSDVMITGGLENQTEGYSALIPFVLHDAANVAPGPMTLASTGIMVGQPDPAMKFPNGTVFFPYTYLRNASLSPMKVNRALYYTLAGGGGQRVSLPSLTISAGSAVQVPLDFGSLGLGGYNGQITVSFSAVSNPGDLIVATGSTDQTANYVFEVLPQLAVTTKSLQDHFWRVGGGYDTMTTLWNSGTAPEDLLITFGFARGKGHYKLRVHLAAGATTAIDMAEIISEGKPDPDGNLIPPGTSGGGMIISGPSDLLDDINVVVGGGTFSVFGATCFPECYTCGPTCEGFEIAPSPIQSAVGGTTQMTATVTLSTGGKVTETGSTTWSSQNTSIATIASGGVATGVAGGSTTIDGVIRWADEPTVCYPNTCQTLLYQGAASVNVCSFTISPAAITNAICNDTTVNSVTFKPNIIPSPSECPLTPATSTCNFDTSGNVSRNEPGSGDFLDSGLGPYCVAAYWASGSSGQDAGTITFQMTLTLNQKPVPGSQTAEVVCH